MYGFENAILQICALLRELNYNLWNSYWGTMVR